MDMIVIFGRDGDVRLRLYKMSWDMCVGWLRCLDSLIWEYVLKGNSKWVLMSLSRLLRVGYKMMMLAWT